MDLVLTIVKTVLLAACAATAAYWLVVLYRVLCTVVLLPTGRDGVPLAANDHAEAASRPVTVIVPAHNEAHAVGPLIASLRAQDHARFRVVLALDRCSDGTREVAERAIDGDVRFEIVEITECPPGWAGKVHAIHAGLRGARGGQDADYLLFTDADCTFAPECLRASTALLAERGLHLLSLLSELATRTWFERLVQPMAGFELLRQYPLLRVNRGGDRQRAFANGQFLLFDARAYHAIGGHEAVKDELLEDIALARLVKQAGLRGGLLSAGGIVRCSMYDTWDQFRRGWKRIYTEAASRRSDRLRVSAWRLVATGVVLPAASVAAAAVAALAGGSGVDVPLLAAAIAALASWATASAAVCLYASAPLVSALLTPLAGAVVAGILFDAARDLRSGRPTEWGGRAYVRADRAAPPATTGDAA